MLLERKYLSVTELVELIKVKLESEFHTIYVEGEVSNISYSSSGHYYFNLVSEDASLSIALFKLDAFKNPIIKLIKNGDFIQIRGSINVYAKRGNFQLLAKQISKIGVGDLKEKFEFLKSKLASEGLFDLDRKKIIPKYTKKIAIITSPQGAALQDFLKVYKRRSIWTNIIIIPALTQGEDAPQSMIKALKLANQVKDIDCIVLTRGGGSLEDLWAYNNEELVREIDKINIPIISAVGHEVDFVLTDYVADLRVETPTAAAEYLTQFQLELRDKLENLANQLKFKMSFIFNTFNLKMSKNSPMIILEKLRNFINRYNQKLNKLNITNRLYDLTRIHEKQFYLDEMIKSIKINVEQKFMKSSKGLERNYSLLCALGPLSVLNRGYVIVKTKKNICLTSKNEFEAIPSSENLKLIFHDGEATVEKV